MEQMPHKRPNNHLEQGGCKPLPLVPIKESNMKQEGENFRLWEYAVFAIIMLAVLVLCVSVGSVSVPFGNTATIIWNTIFGLSIPGEISSPAIIYASRLPRVICVALVGASLSLCGGAMQGLLKNPLADGSTLGVSSGASLGAVIAIAFGITIPSLPFAGTIVMAILFAFLSLIIILSLAYKLDCSLSTNTIILIGVIYSMFVSSIMSLIITFASDKVKHITFWTMGSLAGSSYRNALLLLITLIVCSAVILSQSRELNAFAIGEENAMHIGVNVRRVKLIILITVSALIGVCVSIGGTIAFVGLVTPHIVRMLVGPNHRRLLPASLFGGAIFLMLADLLARTLLNPLELPIGVVTSLIGAALFVVIFYKIRSARG
jgi:iron complex transport system permease protein